MVQGQRDLLTVAQLLLSELAPLVSAQRGTFYIAESADGDSAVLKFMAGYAIDHREEDAPQQLRFGQGLVGQCAREKQRILGARRFRMATCVSTPAWAPPRRPPSLCCLCCLKAK